MDIFDVIENTWPAASQTQQGVWKIRDGQGGGKRVSSAELMVNTVTKDDIDRAEAAMIDLGQDRLFMIRPGQDGLDAMLEQRGYDIIDPVNIYVAPSETVATQRPPKVMMFSVWPRLAIEEEIWKRGGIGPNRWAVMDRVKGPKTTILGRFNDQPAAAAFIAGFGDTAMLHALEVLDHQRKQGVATHLMRHAAYWALDNGFTNISVVCVKTNTGANRLYSSLGMQLITGYHYRIKKGHL